MSAKRLEWRCASMWRLQSSAVHFAYVAAFLASLAQLTAASEPQVIRQWHTNGRLKIERQVTTDSDGKAINHGTWQQWDPTGTLIADGHYAVGQRVGPWEVRFHREQAELLYTRPFDQFAAPFVSRANFVDGQMDGEWIMADAHGRTCSRVTLEHGQRSGPATLWLPDGRLFREATFLNGLPTGELRELDDDGEFKTIATYADGYQLVNKVTYFPERERKHIEATCMAAVVTQLKPDDYAQLCFAQYATRKTFARHGLWRSWYSNGQLQCQGNYQFGRQDGTFTWWHANGLQAATGRLVDGKPDGTWTWWYAGGQQAATAEFAHGTATLDRPVELQSRQTAISGSFTPNRRTAVTRRNPQLY